MMEGAGAGEGGGRRGDGQERYQEEAVGGEYHRRRSATPFCNVERDRRFSDLLQCKVERGCAGMGLGAEDEPEGGLLPLHLQLWYGSVTLLALFFYEPVLASPLYRRPSWLPLAALPTTLRMYPAARLCVDIATTLPSGATDDEVRKACIDNTLCRWRRGAGASKGKCVRVMS